MRASLPQSRLWRNLSGKSPLPTAPDREAEDVFGLKDADTRLVSGGDNKGKPEYSDLLSKYEQLVCKRKEQANREHITETTFGSVRFDSENVPLQHGQFDVANENKMFVQASFLDDLYMKDQTETSQIQNDTNKLESSNFVEDQFLANMDTNNPQMIQLEADSKVQDADEDFNLDFIDKQYFTKDRNKQKVDFTQPIKKSEKPFLDVTFEYAHLLDDTKPSNQDVAQSTKKLDDTSSQSKEEIFEPVYKKKRRQDEESQIITDFSALDPTESKEEDEETKPRTAWEYIKAIKQGKAKPVTKEYKKLVDSEEESKGIRDEQKYKLDSKGFRLLDSIIPVLTSFTYEEILQELIKRVLFENEHILAINKPYGLVCQGEKSTATNPIITTYLEDLARIVKVDKLHLVHRLDKDATGCLLLAKNQKAAHLLNRMFLTREITKNYWIVTKGVPDPPAGVIDIPIKESRIGSKQRMALNPVLDDFDQDLEPLTRSDKNARRAVTQYKTLDSSGNAALIDVTTQSGVKHQIRVHFGFGLRCPVLGDHKYSYLDKLAPQRLSSDMLQALKVRQSKVRDIPLHLHARQILIPEMEGKTNIWIRAPLPRHFANTLRFLKLNQN